MISLATVLWVAAFVAAVFGLLIAYQAQHRPNPYPVGGVGMLICSVGIISGIAASRLS